MKRFWKYSWKTSILGQGGFFFLIILFVYFWLWWVFVTVQTFLSSCGEQGYSVVELCGWFLLLQSTASRRMVSVITAHGFSSCGSQALEHRLHSCSELCTGLVAPRHVGSPWTRNRTCVSCIGRCILYHWATREALLLFYEKEKRTTLLRFLAQSSPHFISYKGLTLCH